MALRKPAYQSSRMGFSVGRPIRAKLAVDGNRDTDFWRFSCTRTSTEKQAWFVVDLQKSYSIKRVELTTRRGFSGHYSFCFVSNFGFKLEEQGVRFFLLKTKRCCCRI